MSRIVPSINNDFPPHVCANKKLQSPRDNRLLLQREAGVWVEEGSTLEILAVSHLRFHENTITGWRGLDVPASVVVIKNRRIRGGRVGVLGNGRVGRANRLPRNE